MNVQFKSAPGGKLRVRFVINLGDFIALIVRRVLYRGVERLLSIILLREDLLQTTFLFYL